MRATRLVGAIACPASLALRLTRRRCVDFMRVNGSACPNS
jgi:hypothetical protein